MRKASTTVLVALVSHVTVAASHAGIVTEHIEFDEWSALAGDVTAVTFTEYPAFTVITDQYADLGVIFTDGNDFVGVHGTSVIDSHWLSGSDSDSITVQFDAPRRAVGAHFPGVLFFELYNGDQLLYVSTQFPDIFSHTFAGLVSAIPFDRVVLASWLLVPTATIDNLYFGPPVPAPGILTVMAAGFLLRNKRRRC